MPPVGGTAVWAAVSKFYKGQPLGPRTAMIWGAAIIVVSAVLGIALIVRADVASRSAATIAQYRARAEVASVFVGLARSNAGSPSQSATTNSPARTLDTVLAMLAASGRLTVRLKNEPYSHKVSRSRNIDQGGIELQVGEAWSATTDVEDWDLTEG